MVEIFRQNEYLTAAKLNRLRARVDAQDTSIAALEVRVTTAETDISTAETDIAALETELRQFTVLMAGGDAETVPVPLLFDIVIPAGTYTVAGRATAAATGSTAYTLEKDGATVGTWTFGVSGDTASLVVGSATTIAGAGADDCDVVGPATADATLAGVALSVPYRRVRA